MNDFIKPKPYDKWELFLVGVLLFVFGVFIGVILAQNIN